MRALDSQRITVRLLSKNYGRNWFHDIETPLQMKIFRTVYELCERSMRYKTRLDLDKLEKTVLEMVATYTVKDTRIWISSSRKDLTKLRCYNDWATPNCLGQDLKLTTIGENYGLYN